jgi:hypothetical protein
VAQLGYSARNHIAESKEPTNPFKRTKDTRLCSQALLATITQKKAPTAKKL